MLRASDSHVDPSMQLQEDIPSGNLSTAGPRVVRITSTRGPRGKEGARDLPVRPAPRPSHPPPRGPGPAPRDPTDSRHPPGSTPSGRCHPMTHIRAVRTRAGAPSSKVARRRSGRWSP
ncbi:hypothetical protein GCM10010472_55040 [Pseudonocardia halophobica]